MAAHPTIDTYAMGRTDHEEQRLQRQAAIYETPMRQLFAAAGLGPGMTVLDLGSGAGDVALLAAELVDPTGRVIGVDMNPAILETARRRATAAGHANITFLAGDLRELVLDYEVNAIVGRLILCHLPDPVAVLRHLLPYLRPGGVVAFYDLDSSVPVLAHPPVPLAARVSDWVKAALTYAGVDVTIGMNLHRIFLEAGLEAPQIAADARIGGSHAFIEECTTYTADTVRTLLPHLLKGGLATEEEVGIDTLAERFRDELLGRGSVVRGWLFMGAWAHMA